MWSEVEREVNKWPNNTLASLRAKISEAIADMSREVVIRPCKMFQSHIEAHLEASGDFIKQMCMLYAYKLFLKFSFKCINPNYLFYSFK
jgi:hypothetical protein